MSLYKRVFDRGYNFAIRCLPDEASLQLQYYKAHGRLANLRHPRRFTEKIQVRKLRDHDQRFARLADKILVKAFVAERLGLSWVTPTLWHGSALPPVSERTWPKPYTLKASHGSGWNLFVQSDQTENWEAMQEITDCWLNKTYGAIVRERNYQTILPRLLVEPYFGTNEIFPVDYKFFCFDGRVEFIHVVTERHLSLELTTLDRGWNLQPVSYSLIDGNRSIPTTTPEKPRTFEAMIAAAEHLSKDFDFVRVDFYEVDGWPRFGEMTFCPSSGYKSFVPDEYDFKFGEMWKMDMKT